MGILKGKLEHQKFLSGKTLTRKEAILAQCYICNGEHVGEEKDCKSKKSCPLYEYFPYRNGVEIYAEETENPGAQEPEIALG